MIIDELADEGGLLAAMATVETTMELDQQPPAEVGRSDWMVLADLHSFCTARAYEQMARAEEAGALNRMKEHVRSVQVIDVMYAQARRDPAAYTFVGHYLRRTATRHEDHAEFRREWKQLRVLFAS